MIARCSIAASIALASLATPALAAPPFSSITDGFVGTPFRGVALGQSRAEVEAALAKIGKHCADLTQYRMYDFLMVESYDNYTACRILDEGGTAMDFLTGGLGLVTYELSFGMPIYAVSFLDDKAAAISLPPEYFNAQGATELSFSQSLVDNYPIFGLEQTESGWRGSTDKGEIVQLWRGGPAVPLWVTIFQANDSNESNFE